MRPGSVGRVVGKREETVVLLEFATLAGSAVRCSDQVFASCAETHVQCCRRLGVDFLVEPDKHDTTYGDVVDVEPTVGNAPREISVDRNRGRGRVFVARVSFCRGYAIHPCFRRFHRGVGQVNAHREGDAGHAVVVTFLIRVVDNRFPVQVADCFRGLEGERTRTDIEVGNRVAGGRKFLEPATHVNARLGDERIVATEVFYSSLLEGFVETEVFQRDFDLASVAILRGERGWEVDECRLDDCRPVFSRLELVVDGDHMAVALVSVDIAFPVVFLEVEVAYRVCVTRDVGAFANERDAVVVVNVAVWRMPGKRPVSRESGFVGHVHLGVAVGTVAPVDDRVAGFLLVCGGSVVHLRGNRCTSFSGVVAAEAEVLDVHHGTLGVGERGGARIEEPVHEGAGIACRAVCVLGNSFRAVLDEPEHFLVAVTLAEVRDVLHAVACPDVVVHSRIGERVMLGVGHVVNFDILVLHRPADNVLWHVGDSDKAVCVGVCVLRERVNAVSGVLCGERHDRIVADTYFDIDRVAANMRYRASGGYVDEEGRGIGSRVVGDLFDFRHGYLQGGSFDVGTGRRDRGEAVYGGRGCAEIAEKGEHQFVVHLVDAFHWDAELAFRVTDFLAEHDVRLRVFVLDAV